jgi:hypothetical protein
MGRKQILNHQAAVHQSQQMSRRMLPISGVPGLLASDSTPNLHEIWVPGLLGGGRPGPSGVAGPLRTKPTRFNDCMGCDKPA